ncbi:MAG: hypothetical protein HN348_20180 [Proteobacteria bacterium]|nr:hypothetical protein [Pseudomonadota bacterium]
MFELLVGDGEVYSQPDRSHVVVLDPDAGRRHRGGCSCNFGHTSPFWSCLLIPLIFLRRKMNA